MPYRSRLDGSRRKTAANALSSRAVKLLLDEMISAVVAERLWAREYAVSHDPAKTLTWRGSCAIAPISNLVAAAARCHARRSGSAVRSVASAECALRRSCTGADRYTAERTSGWRKVTRSPVSGSPTVSASTAEPRSRAARRLGAAAAGPQWAPSPQEATQTAPRRRRSQPVERSSVSRRPERGCATSRPRPLVSSVGVKPRGSSSSANGFPGFPRQYGLEFAHRA